MKVITTFFLILLILLQYRLWFGNGSLNEVHQLQDKISKIEQEKEGSDWEFQNCNIWRDGYLDWDLLSKKEIESYKSEDPEYDRYHDDWNIKGELLRPYTQDPIGTKYAWTAVMMYMLSHYDYLHE